MVVTVMGGGCRKCKTLLKRTEKAVQKSGSDAQVEYVTDMEAIAAAGLVQTPALLVDGTVRATGRVLSVHEIEELLQGS